VERQRIDDGQMNRMLDRLQGHRRIDGSGGVLGTGKDGAPSVFQIAWNVSALVEPRADPRGWRAVSGREDRSVAAENEMPIVGHS
jgi:hypothetical protein